MRGKDLKITVGRSSPQKGGRILPQILTLRLHLELRDAGGNHTSELIKLFEACVTLTYQNSIYDKS
jgi:hypothetical protein